MNWRARFPPPRESACEGSIRRNLKGWQALKVGGSG